MYVVKEEKGKTFIVFLFQAVDCDTVVKYIPFLLFYSLVRIEGFSTALDEVQ